LPTSTSVASYDSAYLIKFAALAYWRACDYEVSERAYVRALNADLARTDGSWATTDDRTTRLFANMVDMYRDWQRQEALASGNPSVDATVEFALGSLSYAAGIQFEYIKRDYGDADCLRAQFLNRKRAQKVLKAAVNHSGDETYFRSTLLLACKKNRFLRTHDLNEINTKRAAKVSARKLAAVTIQNQNARFEHTLPCSNPECSIKRHEESMVMWCPCRTVCYWNKSCQVAH
jgi:hypothetical protein